MIKNSSIAPGAKSSADMTRATEQFSGRWGDEHANSGKRLIAEYPASLQLHPAQCLGSRGNIVIYASRPVAHISTADQEEYIWLRD